MLRNGSIIDYVRCPEPIVNELSDTRYSVWDSERHGTLLRGFHRNFQVVAKATRMSEKPFAKHVSHWIIEKRSKGKEDDVDCAPVGRHGGSHKKPGADTQCYNCSQKATLQNSVLHTWSAVNVKNGVIHRQTAGTTGRVLLLVETFLSTEVNTDGMENTARNLTKSTPKRGLPCYQ